MNRVLLASTIIFLIFTTSIVAQCASFATDACTTAAPTVVGNSINCDPPLNNAGRRNFRVTNMIANATYQISNCGSGFDTQMTIRDLGGVVVGYNDDNGPACTGTAASIDFVPPADGDYRIQINRFFCQSSGFLETGDITVTLIADPPSPLSNDDCSNAIPLTVNSGCIFQTYTNLGATDSGIADPGCALYAGGDVWFSVTVPASGNITIDTDTGGMTDSGMATYSGTCGALTLIECDDDDSDNGLMSSITHTGLTPGSTVFIRVWEYNNDNQGTFGICVSEPPAPPTNDECVDAIPLTTSSICNYSFYDNSSATDSAGVTAPGCAFYSGGDVWFSVVVDSTGEVTIDTQSASLTDSGMALYSGSCGSLTLIECDDDDSGNGLMSMITLTGRTPGETIYIRFWEYGNDNQGTFGICATSPIPPNVYGVTLNCPGDASQPLTSTIGCQGELSIGNTITGSLNAATDPVAEMPLIFIQSGDPCAFEPETSNYTTVNFTVDTSGAYTFAMETPTPYFDAMGYIYETASGFVPGTCSAGYVAGDDDDGPDLDPLITANLLVGVTYTLVTTKFSFSNTTHTGPFTWNVTGPPRDIDWYTTATGGTPIGSGSSFDPVGVAGSPLTDTNTPGIYSFWGACPSTPNVRLQADFIIGKIWDGSQPNDNWMDPLNWSDNTIPTPSDCVVIPNTGNNPVLYNGSNGEALNLTVNSGAILTQQSNSTLTIVNFVDVEAGGTYSMEDSSSLIQVDNVANTVDGTFTMDRNTNIRVNDYVYWSSPVISFNIENVSPATPNGYKYEWLPYVNRPPGPPGPLNFGEWASYDSGPMDVGKGYIVKGPTGHSATPSVYSATFSGTPNNGIIIQAIERSTYTGGNYTYQPNPGGDNILVTSDDDNWNFIGNPYPSAINAIDFLTHLANTNIDGVVYLWTHGSDIAIGNNDPFYNDYVYNYDIADYIAYNSSGTSSPSGFNGNIGAGQGFFVLMTDIGAAIEAVTFDNTMRSSTYANDQFYRNSNSPGENNNVANRIWLDYISDSGQTNTTLIAYVEGATNESDRMFDAATTTGNGLNLYSMIDDKAYLIQGRQLPFVDSDTVPIGINIIDSGIQTIAINSLEGLFNNANQDIYLEDLATGIIHDLKDSPYTFSSDEGITNNRFILRYNSSSLGIDDHNSLEGIRVFEENERIVVKSDFEIIQTIEVFDILGRQLYSNLSVDNNLLKISAIKPEDLTLFLKIKLVDGKQKIAKIIF